MSQRSELADAAIAVVAAHGSRGLTHRAVDAAAGVGAGTTSAYFRTRQALIEGMVRRLVELDARDLAPQFEPELTIDSVASALAVLLDGMMAGAGRERTLARYHAFLEATHRPELRSILEAGVPLRTQMAQLLTALGGPDPDRQAHMVVAFLDGLLYDRVVGTGALASPPPGSAENVRELGRSISTVLRAAVEG